MPREPNPPGAPGPHVTTWSWLGFSLGLLLYLIVSEAFGWVPGEEVVRGLWFTAGLVPAFIGFCIGFARAERHGAQRGTELRSSP